jgi:hypothetical protein
MREENEEYLIANDNDLAFQLMPLGQICYIFPLWQPL